MDFWEGRILASRVFQKFILRRNRTMDKIVEMMNLYKNTFDEFDDVFDFLNDHKLIRSVTLDEEVQLMKIWKQIKKQDQISTLPEKIEKTEIEIQKLEQKIENLQKKVVLLKLKNENRKEYLSRISSR
jgi:TolA-binding protein